MEAYLWKWVPSRGKSGGILVGINTEFLDVGSFIEGTYMLQLNLWDKQIRTKWNLITVYGAAQDEKDAFLSELALFCSKNKEPNIIGGDFNIIRYDSGKNKKNGTNAIISAYGLIDTNMSGGKYTWSNNQPNPTLEKLDRYLVSKQWEDLFPRVTVSKLPREVSDHNSLILSTNSQIPLRYLRFRFELSWFSHPES